ncbi:hypothetical protein [Streptomyces antibioticus]|uniref:Uncharacterized protein n=1 Tax=Streptomyces antibioticus TaxID=1890 RepID=A0AAE7CKY9_STRAT|nr:hypothetical protein [Streptomyces antibioticus]OOQ52186.1 hypothetical protein AFM16_14770 [Streptomyces antibioticus]QIT44704.1 hypothetical protein HCX60_14975 [Streptomyces antibioticus]
MTRSPRTIDDILDRARVLQGPYTRADLEAARETVARRVNELRWERALDDTAVPSTRSAVRHERAMTDLRLLARAVIRDPGAVGRVTAFDDHREPDGALAFACLLYVAEPDGGAQFWWEYAAGAGSVTGALCLYLMHLSRSELRDARHWAHQIGDLRDLGWDGYMPVDHRAERVDADPLLGTAVRYVLPPGRAVPEAAVRDAVGRLAAEDAGLGPVRQPTADLAGRWCDLASV